jgi:hypothetical protein
MNKTNEAPKISDSKSNDLPKDDAAAATSSETDSSRENIEEICDYMNTLL